MKKEVDNYPVTAYRSLRQLSRSVSPNNLIGSPLSLSRLTTCDKVQ